MTRETVCSGFGGQGVLTAGKILMYVAHKCDYKVTWFPSYGDEVRGGVANCNVIISKEKVLSPYADHPDLFMALSEGALDRYEVALAPGADCFVNSSIVPDERKIREDVTVYRVPATEIAQKLGNEAAANIVMLGYMNKKVNLFPTDDFEKYMCEYFDEQQKSKYNEKNLGAYRAGFNFE